MRREGSRPKIAPTGQGVYTSCTQANRIPALDGWRGIAILLVIASHTGIALGHHTESLGQHGVAIFFVLSGFLITHRLQREQEACGSIHLKHFYIRRFFRLMPAAWTFLALRSLMLLYSGRGLESLELPACLFFFRNYVDGSGAHATTAGHFWSLSIEEQFYLLWPALLILVGKKRARWAALFGAMAVACWRFLHLGELTRLPIQATFATQYRADALLLGCAAALFLPDLRRYMPRWTSLALVSSLIACISIDRYLVPFYESAIIALLLVVTSESPDTLLGKVLDWKPLMFVGALSYSLYLWQQPMFDAHFLRTLCLYLPALLGVAYASYRFIETPLIEKARIMCSRSPGVIPRPAEVGAD